MSIYRPKLKMYVNHSFNRPINKFNNVSKNDEYNLSFNTMVMSNENSQNPEFNNYFVKINYITLLTYTITFNIINFKILLQLFKTMK